VTLPQKILRCRLQWFRHVKQIGNSRIPAKVLQIYSIEYKMLERTE